MLEREAPRCCSNCRPWASSNGLVMMLASGISPSSREDSADPPYRDLSGDGRSGNGFGVRNCRCSGERGAETSDIREGEPPVLSS